MTRNHRFGTLVAVIAIAVTAALAVPALAEATVRSFVSTRCSVAPGTSSRLDSAIGPVSFNYPYVAGASSAYADASGQAAGGLALAEGSAAANDDCTTDAVFKDKLTVGAGTTGLPAGTPVTLRLTTRLTGQVDGGARSDQMSSLVSVDTFVSYALTGTQLVCGVEGCELPELARLAFDLRRLIDHSLASANDADGSITDVLRWSWQLESNAAPGQGDSADYDIEVCPTFPTTCVVGGSLPGGIQPFYIPVGARSIEFQTEIGAEIAIDGRLNILAQAYGPSYASGDLLQSLHADITPAPGYEGIALSYQSNPIGPPSDATAPSIDCATADGGWHSGNVSISCTASDSGSGLASAGDAAFTLDTSVPDEAEDGNAQTGSHQVCDVAGNCTTAGPIGGIKVDRKAPSLSLPANLTLNATGPTGAVATYSATATDGGSGVATVACSPASGTAFVIGQTTVTCTATDHAGNSASGTFTVTVAGAKEQLADLIQKVVNASQLSPAAKTLLVGKLNQLLASFDPSNATQRQAVCLALQIFKTAVQLQAGKTITQAQATEWIADANRIRAVLAC